MDKLLLSDWIAVITALGVIVSMVATISTLRKNRDGAASETASKLATMSNDIKHIREKVDSLNNIPERITKVEESTKQAHKRIDTIENKMN